MTDSILQIYKHMLTKDVFTSLGGNTNEVQLQVKEDLDDLVYLVFDRMDLLATLDELKRTKSKSPPCKSII